MFDLSMEEEIDKFYNDGDRFKNFKHLIDFEFKDKEYNSKGFEISEPKHKKKLKAAKFIKPNNKDKSLF